MQERKPALLLTMLGLGVAAVVAFEVLGKWTPSELLREAQTIWRNYLPASFRAYVWTIQARLLKPYVYLATVVVLVLERLIPARPEHRLLSIEVWQDATWYVANRLMLWALLMPIWAGVIHSVLIHFGFEGSEAIRSWHPVVRFVAGFVVIDFLKWASHYARHKCDLLWYFHAVHHSQRDMSLLTDFRVHFVDELIVTGFIYVGMIVMGFDGPAAFYTGIVVSWHSHILHANLRVNGGILKHVLVTPQSHRVHHSRERQHVNVNMGTVLTIWDRLFGTLCKDYDIYPAIGIQDDCFPLESAAGGRSLIGTFVGQVVYPFRQATRWRPSLRAVFRRFVSMR